jgi:hypothetical protein
MRRFSRIVGILLLVVLAASLASAQALLFPSPQNFSPAGCHGHSQPTPAPLSHNCCIAGHSYAVPGSSFSGMTLLPYFGAAIDHYSVMDAVSAIRESFVLVPSPPGSPGLLVLRI